MTTPTTAPSTYTCPVLENRRVGQDIYAITLQVPQSETDWQPGQFVHVLTPPTAEGTLLRRPISIYMHDGQEGELTLVYALKGEGTRALAGARPGNSLDILGPLGNGFVIDPAHKRLLLIGGGMGAAPLMQLGRAVEATAFCDVVLCFQNEGQMFSPTAYAAFGCLHIATETGSMGIEGRVTDVLPTLTAKYDAVYACGPEAMYAALVPLLKSMGLYEVTQVSLEQRMGCGVGACLVCNCEMKCAYGSEYARVCADGPVFPLSEVVL